MNKNYLQLDFTSGNFFSYSKEEKEGYEKHVSSKGNTSFRKWYKEGVSGKLDSVSIYEGNFGPQISMNIKNDNEVYYVPVEISDQRGNVATYAESLIKLLPALNKEDNVEVRGYNFTPEGEQYAKIGMSIKIDGEKVKGQLTNAYYKGGELVDGDIPAIEWKKNALGKSKPSAVSLETKDTFLLEVLKVQTDRLKWVGSNSSQTPTETPKAKEPVGAVKEESNDDLPF
jgi:hypothetical protein